MHYLVRKINNKFKTKIPGGNVHKPETKYPRSFRLELKLRPNNRVPFRGPPLVETQRKRTGPSRRECS